MTKGDRVVIGMSGGVDSSVAALLLKRQGYEVVGLFMHNWEEPDNEGFCPAEADYEDVKSVCNSIGIPYYTVNFAEEYLDRVFAHFLKEYSEGRTPNPDVLCNREIKFDAFKRFAKSLGAKYIATGHYAGLDNNGAQPRLIRAKCAEKDQTYFLNQLSREQLSDVIFPLQNLMKTEVRSIAQDNGFTTAKKKDSTGICFIGERRFKDFLKNYIPAKPGEIYDTDGRLIGRHDGLMYYTLGQRKGLGIGGRNDSGGGRWFVIEKDLKNNVLIVSEGEHEKLFSRELIASEFNWISGEPSASFKCTAKFRYRQPDQKVEVKVLPGNKVRIIFDEKQRAITPGQYAVLYDNEYCLGGGVINEVIF